MRSGKEERIEEMMITIKVNLLSCINHYTTMDAHFGKTLFTNH